MSSSRKYPYPAQGRLTEIPRGRGVSKAQFFKGKYGTKMEFPGGWGFKLKNLPWEGYGYFLQQHNHIKHFVMERECLMDPPNYYVLYEWLLVW